MFFLRTNRSHLFYTLFKHQKPSLSTQTQLSLPKIHEFVSGVDSFFPFSIPQRAFSISEQLFESASIDSTDSEISEFKNNMREKKGKKPLDVLFKEAVGLSENLEEESETSDSEEELNEGEVSSSLKLKEIHELKKKLRKLEREVRSMKGNVKNAEKKERSLKREEPVSIAQSKPNGLSSLFTSKSKSSQSIVVGKSSCEQKSDVLKQEQVQNSIELMPMKELSPEMISLVIHLHEKGYLKNASFLPSNKLDLSRFSTMYSRTFLCNAAQRFGKDHQEMAKCLPEDDLKRLALFGCPNVPKKTVFAAKRLRSYFSIQEDIVCRGCKLKSSCNFVYHKVGGKVDDLNLADVMRILTLYALELVPLQLTIPDEIKDSTSKLLKQVIKPIE